MDVGKRIVRFGQLGIQFHSPERRSFCQRHGFSRFHAVNAERTKQSPGVGQTTVGGSVGGRDLNGLVKVPDGPMQALFCAAAHQIPATQVSV